MGTKRNPGKYDCYANAEPDEPMFVLLGRDPLAPTLLRLWALLRHRSVECADTSEAEKVAEALQCADAMANYGKNRGKSLTTANEAICTNLVVEATKGMHEHPETFDEPCDCDLCRSYG